MQMAAVRGLGDLMRRSGAEEILFVSEGDNPAVHEAPAVFSVWLRGLPHRLVDGRHTAVAPARTAIVLIAPGDLPARGHYIRPAGDQLQIEEFALRPGEGAYLRRVLTRLDNAIQPPRAAGAARLGNGVEIIGYGWQGQAAPGAVVQWELWWRPGGPAPDAAEYHFFNHLVDASGDRWGQQDGASLPAGNWRANDRVVSFFSLPVVAEAPQGPFWVRTGMYRYPDLADVPLLDEAGNPAGEWVTLGPLE
jgi:hypothetical protein